jgi:hypothetical protein
MEGGAQQPQEGRVPSQEELQAQIEEQLSKVRVHDLLLESVVGILNLSARRIAKPDERDLDQARLGIDAVRAVVDMLEPEPAKAVRDALSELQMLYAREASGADTGEDEGAGEGQSPGSPPPAPERSRPPSQSGGADLPPRLWTPPGSSS